MKKILKRFLSSTLVLCMALSCLTLPASAASSYNPEAALSYANQHWDDGVGLCAEFVSNCLKQGGLSSWSRECTDLYNQLVREVVDGQQIASVQHLATSGNRILGSENLGKVSPGDVIFWRCISCPKDDVGGDIQHTAIINNIDDSGVRITQHNNARNNVIATTNNCYCCGRRYSDIIAIHFEKNSPAPTPEYFSCNVQLNSTSGQTVDLFKEPGAKNRSTYFSKGQTSYSSYGVILNGETWYKIQALDNNGQPTDYWLNSNSRGVTVIDLNPKPAESSSTSYIEYFDVDSEIRCTNGKTVDLYYNIGDSSRGSYFSKGQTAWATRAARINGTVWYRVKAMDGGQAKDFWLNSASAGVTVIDHASTGSSWITCDLLEMNLSLSENPSALVRIRYSEQRISGDTDYDALGLTPEWVEVGDDYAVARFTVTKVGEVTYTFTVFGSDGSQATVSFPIRVTA